MIKIVDGLPYIAEIKDMLVTYLQELKRNLSFQHIDDELQNPVEKYTAPNGEIIVAIQDQQVLGMVAYYKFAENICEMKRLFVYNEFRHLAVGEMLVTEIMKRAKNAGYQQMVLDTILPLQPAIHLYKKFGFQECAPYYHNPMSDVIYMMKEL